jgi:hypothetical protein
MNRALKQCKNPFWHSLLVIVGILALSVQANADSKLSWLEQLKETIATHSIKSVEELLPKIPTEYRKNFSLVFESRSTMGATFEKPRVILRNDNSSIIMAFTGDSKNDQALEIIEQNPVTKRFDFSAISFKTDPPVYSDSKTCVGCHSLKGDPLTIRPIWDTYPDWPGVYGQNHNGAVFNHGTSGTSGIKRLNYEKRGYEKFLEYAKNSPLYRNLNGFGEGEVAPTLAALAEVNSEMGRNFNHRNVDRLAQEMANSLRFPKEYAKIKTKLIGHTSDDEKKLAEGEKRMRQYYGEKADRTLKIISEWGSAKDKAFVRNGLPLSQTKGMKGTLFSPDLKYNKAYIVAEDLVRNLGIRPESASLAFNTLGLVLEDGDSMSWGNTLDPVLNRYLHLRISNIIRDESSLEILKRSYANVKSAKDFVDFFYYRDPGQLDEAESGFESAFNSFAHDKLPDFEKFKPSEEQWKLFSQSHLLRGESERRLRAIAKGESPSYLNCLLRKLQRVIP